MLLAYSEGFRCELKIKALACSVMQPFTQAKNQKTQTLLVSRHAACRLGLLICPLMGFIAPLLSPLWQ